MLEVSLRDQVGNKETKGVTNIAKRLPHSKKKWTSTECQIAKILSFTINSIL